MFCRKCGKEIRDDSEFCRYCGVKVRPLAEPLETPNSVQEDNRPVLLEKKPEIISNTDIVSKSDNPADNIRQVSKGEEHHDVTNNAQEDIKATAVNNETKAVSAPEIVKQLDSFRVDSKENSESGESSGLGDASYIFNDYYSCDPEERRQRDAVRDALSKKRVTRSKIIFRSIAIAVTLFGIIMLVDSMHLNFKYELHGKSATITGYRGNKTNIVIPNKILGRSVTNIGSSAFENNINITSVTLGKNVYYIGDRAFGNCTSLETVYWNFSGNSHEPVNIYAFTGCTNLHQIIVENYPNSYPPSGSYTSILELYDKFFVLR